MPATTPWIVEQGFGFEHQNFLLSSQSQTVCLSSREISLIGGQQFKGSATSCLQVEAPAVFSVEAEWGQGKSAFLEMCAVLMESDEFAGKSVEVARFNAWTQNYHNDPLKDIVAAITSRDSDTNAEREIDRHRDGCGAW